MVAGEFTMILDEGSLLRKELILMMIWMKKKYDQASGSSSRDVDRRVLCKKEMCGCLDTRFRRGTDGKKGMSNALDLNRKGARTTLDERGRRIQHGKIALPYSYSTKT